MNKKIDLSVVIPCYNSEKTIEECINSVVLECEENNLNYEIIVVNDGSTDNSLNILQELQQKNKRIIVFTQKNSGPSVARNLGLENAKGEFIALNDSDDKWLKGKLKNQLEFLKNNPTVSLVCAKYELNPKEKKPIEIFYKKEVFHNYFSPPTSLFRKAVGEIRFKENQKYSEDMRFLLEVMKNFKCVYLPFLATKNVFGKAVFGESGLSSNLWKMEKGELKNIYFAFQIKKINFWIFIFAYCFSFLKFIRRVLISNFKKLNKFNKLNRG